MHFYEFNAIINICFSLPEGILGKRIVEYTSAQFQNIHYAFCPMTVQSIDSSKASSTQSSI